MVYNLNMFESQNMISDNVFLYKNFIDTKTLNIINDELDSMRENQWHIRDIMQPHQSPDLESVIPVLNKINSIIPDGFYITQHTSVNKIIKGGSWGEHSDNADYLNIRESAKKLKDGEDFEEIENIIYGMVFYINNFDGGELYYVNKDFALKPEAGDLVIHGAEDDCRHKVLPVLSEKRYSYSNSVKEKIKIPRGVK